MQLHYRAIALSCNCKCDVTPRDLPKKANVKERSAFPTYLSFNTFMTAEALSDEGGTILKIELGKRRGRFGITTGLGGKQSLLGR